MMNRTWTRILVTGASGLVGGRLIRHLLESSDVQIRAASRTARIWPVGVEGCVTDINRTSTLTDACAGMDAVINLASMPERMCAMDPYGALLVNAGGTLGLAAAAASERVPRFVQLSTYKVYGSSPSGRVSEETPCAPQSHYAITHRAAEDYAVSQHPTSVVLRLANGFGAPAAGGDDCWRLIVNEMCRDAAVQRQITIRSSGRSWRNFVSMQDVVRVLHFAAVDLPAGTYNLGSSESMTLLAVADRVAAACRATLGFVPAVSAAAAAPDEQHAALDFRIDKLARAGFAAGASFDDELTRTLLAAQAAFGGAARRA